MSLCAEQTVCRLESKSEIRVTKHWKTNATRDGEPVTLYVTTTDEKIAEDIACGPGHSLTMNSRSDNIRQSPTTETDHIDFASGAFTAAARKGLTLISRGITPADSIPEGLRRHDLGGKNRPYLTAVFEEANA